MKKITTISIVLLAVTITFVILFSRKDHREATFFAMGGIPVRVLAYHISSTDLKRIVKEIEKHVDELETIYNRYRNDSEISKINERGKGCINVSPKMKNIIERSKYWNKKSEGAFDITVGPLISLWKEASKRDLLPNVEEIEERKSQTGMDNIVIQGEGKICVKRNNLDLDLGAIAKGAILDEAANYLEQSGVKRGLVDAGGDVALFGGGPFRIGIQDPTSSQKILAVLETDASGVVTSGDYERFVTIEGKKYSHIINPKTGRPAREVVSATVIGPNAMDADALATALSVLGREKAIELLSQLEGYNAIIVEKKSNDEFEVWYSKELKGKLSFSKKWSDAAKPF